MATITPVASSIEGTIQTITWTGVSTADTMTGILLRNACGAIGCMQVSGTFGGSTVTLQGSNDATNYYPITDAAGNDIAVTVAGLVEFSTAAAYIKPASAGGVADDVTVVVVLR